MVGLLHWSQRRGAAGCRGQPPIGVFKPRMRGGGGGSALPALPRLRMGAGGEETESGQKIGYQESSFMPPWLPAATKSSMVSKV